MSVTKDKVLYEVTRPTANTIRNNHNVAIAVELNKDGKMSIMPAFPGSGREFRFENSDPNLVEEIAKALLEAVELARKEKF